MTDPNLKHMYVPMYTCEDRGGGGGGGIRCMYVE